MRHKECGGRIAGWTIREHGYCYMRCEACGHYLGGDATEAKVKKLMRTKVWPTNRRT